MAENLYFSRDTKVYIEFDSVIWEMPVLDGFSFSQATNSTEITLAEMESSTGVSRRGRRAFNDSLAPAEWSFSTYVRPYVSAGSGTGAADDEASHHAVEEVLWALMAGADNYDGTTDYDFDKGGTSVTTHDGTDLDIDFDSSNTSTLSTFTIYFVLGAANRKVYKMASCVVNEASIDFDIDGLATINWSGFGSEITDVSGSTIEDTVQPTDGDTTNDGTAIAVGDIWLDSNDGYRLYKLTNVTSSSEASTSAVYEDTGATDNFIRNRLTVLTVAPTTRDPDSDSVNELQASYNLTLTGGTINITNNINYITPEELGKVNIPFGHITGTRTVNGNFTCYLNRTDWADSSSDESANFWEDMKAIDNVVTNSFALTFKVGGASSTPRLEMAMTTAHLQIPEHSIEDVISLDTTFEALPSTISETDEVTVKYVGAT
jgi:hypothetical protein